MSDDQRDQTEAELERTRKVVAAAMAEQIATNDAAAHPSSDADDAEEPEAPAKAPKSASRKEN